MRSEDEGRSPRDGVGGSSLGAASSRARLLAMVVLGAIGAGVSGAAGRWSYAPIVSWDVAAAVFIGWVWLSVPSMDAEVTKRHAVREDPGRTVTDLVVIVAAVASLFAVGVVLVQASSAKGTAQDVLAGLAVASVALSWFTIHTLFMLRYARLYYLGTDRGVDFNQVTAPRYVDFAYLAFTIGMTFQVSDTDLKNTKIRATALRHALLSFLFGAVILAATINLVGQLASGSGSASGS